MNNPIRKANLVIGLGLVLAFMGLQKARAENQTLCARVAVVIGDVTLGAKTKIQVGDYLKQGDIITTRASSFGKILLEDNSIVDVGPESQLVISNCRGDSKAVGDIDLALEFGRIRANVNKLSDQNKRKFRIKTPSSVISVRGTEFYLIWQTNQPGELFENVALIEGSLEIRTQFESSKNPVSLTAGTEFKAMTSQSVPKGAFKIDQLTATEQRALEEQVRVSPMVASDTVEFLKPVLVALLDPKSLPEIKTQPLNLFQGNVAQAQQGNFSVVFSAGSTVSSSTSPGSSSSGTGGGSGGGGGGSGGAPVPSYSSATVRFYDQ